VIFSSGIINLLFDGLTCYARGHFAHCSYFILAPSGLGKILRNSQNVLAYYMLSHRIRGIYVRCVPYLSSRFIPRHEVLSYSLRNNEFKLSIPQPRTNYCKRCFSYSGAVFWNSLPREIKQSNSLKEFKTKLKNHTFQSELIY